MSQKLALPQSFTHLYHRLNRPLIAAFHSISMLQNNLFPCHHLNNLHAAGTKAMMEAALEGVTRPDGSRPLVIAVTQLTSTSQERMEGDLLIREPIDQVVLHYAQCARDAGLDGVVCSPLEAGKVHGACGETFLTVTPGVRFADGDVGDQVRVTTPEKAREIGSDYIVVGRPVTQAADPAAAYRRCVAEFVG